MTNGIARSGPRAGVASAYSALLRFGVAFIVLFVVLPVVFEIVFPSSAFETLWVESTKGAQLERTFGFGLETRSIPVVGAGHQTFPVIKHVVPGGRMARAGVRIWCPVRSGYAADAPGLCFPGPLRGAVLPGLSCVLRQHAARFDAAHAIPLAHSHRHRDGRLVADPRVARAATGEQSAHVHSGAEVASDNKTEENTAS